LSEVAVARQYPYENTSERQFDDAEQLVNQLCCWVVADRAAFLGGPAGMAIRLARAIIDSGVAPTCLGLLVFSSSPPI